MHRKNDGNRIDFRRISDRITVGERTIRAIARVSGWHGGRDAETGDSEPGYRSRHTGSGDSGAKGDGVGLGAGAFVRVTPVEFTVRDGDGEPYTIRVTDPTREALKWMLSAALGAAAVCWLLARIVRSIRENGE